MIYIDSGWAWKVDEHRKLAVKLVAIPHWGSIYLFIYYLFVCLRESSLLKIKK